jgi:integrase/recombinase XerD
MTKTNEARCAGRQRMDAGELAPWVAEFTRRLRQQGYTSLTVKSYDDAARHHAHWLLKAKVAVADIDEAVIDRFARHRYQCPGFWSEKHVSGKYVRRVRRFVEFLGERGLARLKVKSAPPVLERRVAEFQEWLRRHRGIAERTIDRHGRMVMRLLPALGPRPQSWDAETKQTSRAYVKTMAMAIRGYLRFLGTRGLCRAGLEQAVPTIPEWRLSTLPRYIDVAQVEQLFATCDLATPTGLRDRAIMLLLLSSALRVGLDRVFFMLNAPTPMKGAGLLRHSAATAMLRGGATLDMVGGVLRHRSPDTTADYAKVDVTMLQQIAQPWPGDA